MLSDIRCILTLSLDSKRSGLWPVLNCYMENLEANSSSPSTGSFRTSSESYLETTLHLHYSHWRAKEDILTCKEPRKIGGKKRHDINSINLILLHSYNCKTCTAHQQGSYPKNRKSAFSQSTCITSPGFPIPFHAKSAFHKPGVWTINKTIGKKQAQLILIHA